MKINDLSQLSRMLFFTKDTLRQLENRADSLDYNLKYWKKRGIIIALKKGMYILKERWEKEINRDLYMMYLSNKIYEPSYLSLEYVLNKYSLLTEAVYGLTSITTRSTKFFNNDLGRFSYYSISPKLFGGYELDKFYSAPIFIANKTKALFDYLYLRFLKKTPIEKNEVSELRINWENINSKEFKQLQSYALLTDSIRVKKILNLIKSQYYA